MTSWRLSIPRALGRVVLKTALRALQVLLLLWGALALYFCLPAPWPVRIGLACGFLCTGIWAWWWNGTRSWSWLPCVLFLAVLGYYLRLAPSHDRAWRPEVAVMPRAIVEGDRVRLTGYRNFSYRSREDFTVQYEERQVSLDRLTGVDLILSYWKPGPVAHTFVSFHFADAEPVCISIETRPEIGEGFAPLASVFRQFELIYVVGAERDLIGSRANHRGEEVYIYPIRTTPAAARRLFEVYLQRINELAEQPEWYNLLKNNCTLNIVRYANVAGRDGRFDVRHLLNGYFDRYLYRAGLVDRSLPFAELRRRSRINAAAREAAESPEFSRRIRAALPPETS